MSGPLSQMFVAERDTIGFRIWTATSACATVSLLGCALFLLLSDFGLSVAGAMHPRLGWFFGLAAFVLAGQTIWTVRKGYVFCGTVEYVEKAKHLVLYRVWLTIQCVVAVSIGAIAAAIVTRSM